MKALLKHQSHRIFHFSLFTFPLESSCFQSQSHCLLHAKHDVHVLHRLSDGAFQEVVDGRGYEQLVAKLVAMYERLVGVHHLLHVDGVVHIVGEGSVLVKVLICLHDLLYRHVRLYDLCGEDAAGEVAAVGNEVDLGIELTLHLLQTLADLWHMLVAERLIYAHVVVAPREMCRCAGFLACSRAARYGVNGDVALHDAQLGGWQQTQLYAGGKAAWVGHMLCSGNALAVNLGQTIYIVVVGSC